MIRSSFRSKHLNSHSMDENTGNGVFETFYDISRCSTIVVYPRKRRKWLYPSRLPRAGSSFWCRPRFNLLSFLEAVLQCQLVPRTQHPGCKHALLSLTLSLDHSPSAHSATTTVLTCPSLHLTHAPSMASRSLPCRVQCPVPQR